MQLGTCSFQRQGMDFASVFLFFFVKGVLSSIYVALLTLNRGSFFLTTSTVNLFSQFGSEPATPVARTAICRFGWFYLERVRVPFGFPLKLQIEGTLRP